MGFLDVVLGRRKLAAPAPDRLFAMTTAYVTMQTSLGIASRGVAAIVFQPLATADFEGIVRDMEEVVRGVAGDEGVRVESADDSYGFRWLTLRLEGSGGGLAGEAGGGAGATPETGFEGLVVGINAVSTALIEGGYGERILCAVFAFTDSRQRPLYWIYNYKRGAFYPFVPAPGRERERDNEAELRLKAQLGGELPVEAELERWAALWGIPI
jgi:hypothetical protein